jgi:hypothetical protein
MKRGQRREKRHKKNQSSRCDLLALHCSSRSSHADHCSGTLISVICRTFKVKGKIRPEVVDKMVDLHVFCGSQCARAVILGGEAAGIEWEDTVASHMTVARGLIKRSLLHEMALVEELAGMEWVALSADSTTSW